MSSAPNLWATVHRALLRRLATATGGPAGDRGRRARELRMLSRKSFLRLSTTTLLHLKLLGGRP